MMVIVDLTRRSGIFTFLAIWVSKKVKGDPLLLMLSLSLLTAFLSALLDNVTTVLLIVPVAISIADFKRCHLGLYSTFCSSPSDSYHRSQRSHALNDLDP